MIINPGIKARFTLLYGAALILTVVLVSCAIYFFVQRALVGQIENHLRKDLASITEFLTNDISDLQKVAAHGPIELFAVRQGGKSIATSDDWKEIGFDSILKEGAVFTTPRSVTATNGKSYLLQSSTVDAAGLPYLITVAHHEGGIRQALRTLGQIILLILPVAVAISLAIGYAIAGRVLAPIAVITRKAEEIGAENLSERLPVGNGNDEFSRLAMVFNQTFGRIEDSFARLQRFTADASHELRTPLAAIRSIGETVLHTSDGSCDCREAIGSILEESDRLRQLVDSLLLLSRADAGEIKLQRKFTDLASLARETIDLLSVLAEEKHQTITLNVVDKPVALIDHPSVRQALTNLLDNAIKYSPSESVISITVGVTSRDEAFIEIADSGVGIPEQDIPRIFDRFYRVDKGRSREMGGAGLGLSIASWAVESNGGRIQAESKAHRGSVFRVLFPMQA
jgi:heavy metal sensor kinase